MRCCLTHCCTEIIVLLQVQFPWMALANANKHVPSSSSNNNGTTSTTAAACATVADTHLTSANHSLTHPTEAVSTAAATATATASSDRMHGTTNGGSSSKDRRFWEVKKIDPSHTGVSLSAAQKRAHIKVNLTTTTPFSIYM
jgi:hypothetical protein